MALVALALGGLDGRAADNRPRNVLFVAVDDLRPTLGAYGDRLVRSPNLDRLAARGVIFNRAYCQYSVCNPSRTSLLTGLRPDSSGVPGAGGMQSNFRQRRPDLVTLPQQFKQHGYVTRAFGKIFHSCFDQAFIGRTLEDLPSWSEPSWFGRPQYYFSPEGMAAAREAFAQGRVWPRYGAAGKGPAKRTGDGPSSWQDAFVQAWSTEAPEVGDFVPYDGQVTQRALATLRELKDRPFFLAVGLMKPHLPFVAPKKYWDLYDRAKLPLPNPTSAPVDAPAVALPDWNELRGQYTDIPKSGPLDEAKIRELIHGYYACVSYVDALIGRLVDELDALGLSERTVVVVWGDHGFHLGEQHQWGKHTNFEWANRVPLIVSAPGRRGAGARSDRLVELVDVYPTLCELARLPLPGHLEGDSFVPLLDAPARPWKSAAFSQVLFSKTVEGRSMRTEQHRFTLWSERQDPEKKVAVELYDLDRQATERENLAARPEYAARVREMTAKLRAGWQPVRAELAAGGLTPPPAEAKTRGLRGDGAR